MKKSDLENKMVVKTRCGYIYTIIDEGMYHYSGWVSLDSYREDLSNKFRDEFDIVEIYDQCRSLDIDDFVKISQPIWTREEPIEVTIDDIEKIFGRPVKIVKEKKHCCSTCKYKDLQGYEEPCVKCSICYEHVQDITKYDDLWDFNND